MRPYTPPRPLFGAPLGLLLLSLAGSAADAQLNVPVRLTFNNLEDRTTTGSIAHDCNRSAAVWMQEQNGPGWNLMWAVNEGTTWSPALPVQAAVHEDYEPRTMIDIDGTLHAVWQRQTGDAAEIMHGTRVDQSWTVEPITTNATEDITPDIATSTDGRLHVVWAGFDPKSGEGRLFYAKRTVSPPSLWVVEMLPVGDLGPFWTGAQPKIDISGFHDIIHVVYRGGDFGIYNAHYARRNPNGIWEHQILTSPNAEDLVADVAASDPHWPERVVVAMSGNDCFGCPSHVYVRRSDTYGLTFGAAVPASVNHSAELGAVAAASIDDVSVVAAELSGNIFTGNLLLSREDSGLIPDTLPPANHASFYPSIAQTTCTGRGISYIGLGIAFTNYGSEEAPPDSAEVWAIRGPEAVLNVDDPALVSPAQLAVTSSPNPFSSSTVITATALTPGKEVELNIYDSLGRVVRHFSDGSPNGSQSRSWTWDGRDAGGRMAASGIFFLETRQGTARAIDRLILIR
jgi:hypothetical protein